MRRLELLSSSHRTTNISLSEPYTLIVKRANTSIVLLGTTNDTTSYSSSVLFLFHISSHSPSLVLPSFSSPATSLHFRPAIYDRIKLLYLGLDAASTWLNLDICQYCREAANSLFTHPHPHWMFPRFELLRLSFPNRLTGRAICIHPAREVKTANLSPFHNHMKEPRSRWVVPCVSAKQMFPKTSLF